jgi:hypothetical protein
MKSLTLVVAGLAVGLFAPLTPAAQVAPIAAVHVAPELRIAS